MSKRFRRYLVFTAGLTYILMLLGIFTASFGAGLTCGQRWPFCDGWMGLFPATIPSFVEWFHRLVAMVTGFVILGGAYAGWQYQDDRRVAYSITLAVVLLPVQIGLGAVTVTLNGLLPWGYAPIVQLLHYVVALSILGLLTVATARTLATSATDRVGRWMRVGLTGVLLAIPLQYLFSFNTVFAFTPTVQIIYYALLLGMFAVLVAVAVWSGFSTGANRIRWLAGCGTLILGTQMLVARRLWGAVPAGVVDGLTALLVVVVAIAVWLVHRGGPIEPPGGEQSTTR
ncbi:COX15/CtaA family protein [Halocatena halophila]|uniref:COX15/CtaA family protein n=1 Tax=Halocatena halophila TaxID=2814576 RepID=UPI002ED4690A